MSNVVFDYSALSDAKSYAKKVVTGWGCMDSYKDGIKGKLSSPLDEWRLSGEEPYGRGYVSSAQQCITNKQNDLQGKRQQLIQHIIIVQLHFHILVRIYLYLRYKSVYNLPSQYSFSLKL